MSRERVIRTTVALVEAHPNTIGEDYRRVMHPAGLGSALGNQELSVMLSTHEAGFLPGWSSPPWQLDAALKWLGPQAARASVVAVGSGGVGPVPALTMWQDSLARHRAQAAGAKFRQEHRHVSKLLHPALDTVLPQGVLVPVGLAEQPCLLLAAPSVPKQWGVGAASVLLRSLITGGAGRGRKVSVKRQAPAPEIMAEAVGVAREFIPRLGTVVDGTLWGVLAGPGERRCVARNLLLAGTDPVAVDVVAMRLAGIDPLQVPWLRICHDRGFGRILPAEIRLVGRTDLLGLDFELPDGTIAAERAGRSFLGGVVARMVGRAQRRAPMASLKRTVWAELADAYATGRESLAASAAEQF